MLADPACRILTLHGPGGIGKTRLALAVAARQTAAFADGVVFVALASVSTPSQIVSTIGDTLGLSFAGHSDPTADLLGYLRERQILLVLDNFEHLLAACGRLAETLLARCPGVVILATSREPLHLPGEVDWRVPSMTMLDLNVTRVLAAMRLLNRSKTSFTVSV